MSSEAERNRRQAALLLARLGLRRSSKAVQYLSVILAECGERLPPGPELWEKYAARFGQKPVNIQSAIRMELQRAYRRDPLRLSELAGLGEVLLAPPRPREFILMSLKWLRQNEFVWDGAGGWSARSRPEQGGLML